MNKPLRFPKILLSLIAFMALSFTLFSQMTAKAVVTKADAKMRGEYSEGEMTITTIRPKWTREMKVKSWSKGTDYSLIMITSPARDKGTIFLKRDKEVWNWVPSIERTIKLPPSMMSQSWMGTDFNNDDLVRESSIVVDYTHALKGEETIEGLACYKIELIPLPEAAVIWGKIFIWIDKADFMVMKSEYYDEDDILVNLVESSDVKMMGGKKLPARMEMIPVEKEGHKTVMVYDNLIFDRPIDDSFFTEQNMKRVR